MVFGTWSPLSQEALAPTGGRRHLLWQMKEARASVDEGGNRSNGRKEALTLADEGGTRFGRRPLNDL